MMENEIKNFYSFRLFKELPSFADGITALIDMPKNETRYNYDVSAEEADINSLRADWCAIGADLWKTIKDYEREGTKK